MKHETQFDHDEPGEWADERIGPLLVDAYDVPPIPKSLDRRLDRILVQHWGVSPDRPRNASARNASKWMMRLPQHVSGSWKSWSIAVSLLLAFLFVLQPWAESPVYGWNAMVEALSRQGFVAVGEAEAGSHDLRCLSLGEQVLAKRSGDNAVWFDFQRRELLQHDANAPYIRRRALNKQAKSPNHERMIISFLLGNHRTEADLAEVHLPDLYVVEENWVRQGNRVRLDVTFGGDLRATGARNDDRSEERLSVSIWIDPDTHLPLEGRIGGLRSTSRILKFTYPVTTASQWLAQTIPADLPVIDEDDPASWPPSPALAVEPGATAGTTESATNVPSDLHRGEGRLGIAQPRDDTISPPSDPPAVLQGSATLGWSPVPILELSADEVIRQVDQTLEQLWDDKGVQPAQPATDEELLRRVYLDLAGRTPTVNEIHRYMGDDSPSRYEALVDRLLASRDHATHLATVWRSYLIPDGIDLSRLGGVDAFERWLSERFAVNQPYDGLVRDLLTAEGRLASSGPLLFYAALKLDADQVAAKSARVFLGMRLDCAQCHDDPFEPWTQDDFWSYAAFFAQISRPQADLEAVSSVMRVRDVTRGEVTMPDSNQPIPPRLLDGSVPPQSAPSIARREQLARWLTTRDNPFFAKAAVNRVWSQLLGRGIVDPVDGFGLQHSPVSPELLDLLAGHFVHTEFDLRELFRTITLSRAYRLSSGSSESDSRRRQWFAQQNVKILTAEQLYDCITVATLLVSDDSDGYALERLGNVRRSDFLRQFQSISSEATEYQAGIPQVLTLMNGRLISDATGLASSGLLKSLEAPFFTDDQRIEVLYLATLSRRPSPKQWTLLRQYVQGGTFTTDGKDAADVKGRDPKTVANERLADILWALLNSAEFAMNH
jgi:hypothetical protein